MSSLRERFTLGRNNIFIPGLARFLVGPGNGGHGNPAERSQVLLRRFRAGLAGVDWTCLGEGNRAGTVILVSHEFQFCI